MDKTSALLVIIMCLAASLLAGPDPERPHTSYSVVAGR